MLLKQQFALRRVDMPFSATICMMHPHSLESVVLALSRHREGRERINQALRITMMSEARLSRR